MTNGVAVVALTHTELAAHAPVYEQMRAWLVKAESVDEIAHLTDVAVAAQAYYRQSRDIENELAASRIRVRAERKLGEKLQRMRETGERSDGRNAPNVLASRGATPTTLSDLGIPRDRASRAMQLADVPQGEFDAALDEPKPAQPRRILSATRKVEVRPELVPIGKTLDLWGRVRDLGQMIRGNELPSLDLWRTNLQPFQLAHLREFIPIIVQYLTAIQQELDA